MTNKTYRKSKDNSSAHVSTRNQLREAAKLLEVKNMAHDQQDSPLSQVLSLINSFDLKKIPNVKFYLKEFDQFLDRAKVKDDFRLQILKSKFVGSAQEKLAQNDDLNSEKDYAKFKQKILDVFSKRESFTQHQTNFNQVKQKPNQSVKEFIEDFNILAYKYLQTTGYDSNKGAKDFFELIKINKFLDGISPNISLELRKLDIKEFDKLCEKALQLETVFNSATFEQINNVSKNMEMKNSDYENLLRQNQDQLNYISELSEQLNSLKVKNVSEKNKDKVQENYCAICKTNKHDLQKCYFNLKNNSKKPNVQQKQNLENFVTRGDFHRSNSGFGFLSPSIQGTPNISPTANFSVNPNMYPNFNPNCVPHYDNNVQSFPHHSYLQNDYRRGNFDNYHGQNYFDNFRGNRHFTGYNSEYCADDNFYPRGANNRNFAQQGQNYRESNFRRKDLQTDNVDRNNDSQDSSNRGARKKYDRDKNGPTGRK